MNIAIIKYNAGNIQSVLFAMERIGAAAVVTDDHELISKADRVIFPGVGEAGTAMKYLREKKLDKIITGLSQPVLGICLGMQLMCEYSEEGNTNCLGIFESVAVKKFETGDAEVKIPQVGWNTIHDFRSSIFSKVEENSHCYFVHSYYAPVNDFTIGITDYIIPYSSAMKKNNFTGVQFHPEKSATAGEQILKNFLSH